MAALTEERYRPEDARAVKGPKRGSFAKHKTRSSSDAVKQSEQSLRHLLEDFEEGRLNAFGKEVIKLMLLIFYTLLLSSD
jgi:G:T/U-mismatch repair DNA glycosylase